MFYLRNSNTSGASDLQFVSCIPSTPNSRSYLTQFSQPDSIIPDQYNSQAWDRYSYVFNNPVRYTDPTGHRCTDTSGVAISDCENGEFVQYLESSYAIRIRGRWKSNDLNWLNGTLGKMAGAVGGRTQLNSQFQDALKNDGLDMDRINFVRHYVFSDSDGDGKDDFSCHACWNSETGTITLSEDVFTPRYQNNLANANPSRRPSELGLDSIESRIMVTIAHEIGHVMADAKPLSVLTFAWNSGNPVYFTGGHPSYSNIEENWATALGIYVIGSGDNYPDYAQLMWGTGQTLDTWFRP